MLKIKKSDKDSRRVVVTGLGILSSLGIGWQEFWKNIMAGKSGISKITAFDTSQYERHYAGEVKNFDPAQFIDKKKISLMGRASQMAIAASKLAIKDGKLKSDLSKFKIGVCIGTTMGEPQIMEKLDERCFSTQKPLAIDFMSALLYPSSSIATSITHEFKLHGPSIVFSNACAAGNYSIGYSFDLIKSGKMDYMLAGGSDALSRIAFTGFSRLFAMAPEKCQPFDKNRKGIIIGEGACVLLLETLESARKRSAPVYAEIKGYGMSCDAKHMTIPTLGTVTRAMILALKDAGVTSEEIDYINAHGTGTLENDRIECQAIKKLIGSRIKKVPVSSIKSMLGHTMGTAAAFETAVCCLAIKDGCIPPTINFEEKDSQCDIDCVPNKGRRQKLNVILNNSQAFGGNNACVVVKKISFKNSF